LNGGKVADAKIVLGHVAPAPWVAAAAAKALNGSAPTEAQAMKAAEAAVTGAKPLSGNAYKIQMVKAAVKRAILEAAA
jgi:xanthine dehydrogenase YagS FAD-binding subunit